MYWEEDLIAIRVDMRAAASSRRQERQENGITAKSPMTRSNWRLAEGN